MCGRFTLSTDLDELQIEFSGFTFPDDVPPRFNIAPSQEIFAIRNIKDKVVDLLRWGLVPFWAKDPKIGNRMINARGETIAEKPSFRNAFKKRRCLILADGFYEWRKEPGEKIKTPMYIHLQSGKPFAFAGLWETWKKEGEVSLNTCTIITTEPNSLMEKIHNRMPVILPPEAYELWLSSEEQPSDVLLKWLRPYPEELMTAHPVSRMVNSPATDNPECIEPVEAKKEPPSQSSLF